MCKSCVSYTYLSLVSPTLRLHANWSSPSILSHSHSEHLSQARGPFPHRARPEAHRLTPAADGPPRGLRPAKSRDSPLSGTGLRPYRAVPWAATVAGSGPSSGSGTCPGRPPGRCCGAAPNSASVGLLFIATLTDEVACARTRRNFSRPKDQQVSTQQVMPITYQVPRRA